MIVQSNFGYSSYSYSEEIFENYVNKLQVYQLLKVYDYIFNIILKRLCVSPSE